MDAGSKKLIKILYQDDALVAIDKPSGVHVHPPEDPRFVGKISYEENALARTRDQVGRYLYPVHRIDRSTSGVLLFALTQSSASRLCGAFASGLVNKEYWALVRGHVPLGPHTIDRSLKRDSSATLAPAVTRVDSVQQFALPTQIGKRGLPARYSFIKAWPKTGRHHQIRRHLAGLSHPILGDTVHGDGFHNRYFRTIGLSGLCLRAHAISFAHPLTGKQILVESPLNSLWLRIFDFFDQPALHGVQTERQI